MSRRVAKAILYPLAALLTCAGVARAQWAPDPFAAAALMAGPQGFARPPVNGAVVGGYAYVPLGGVLVGAQGGAAPSAPNASRAAYAIATAGLPVYRGLAWQTYPFLGAGRGILRARSGSDATHLVLAAGLGFDAMIGPESRITVGSRVGYLTRSAGDDDSVAYVTVSLGFATRRATREATIAARRMAEP